MQYPSTIDISDPLGEPIPNSVNENAMYWLRRGNDKSR